MPLNFHPLEFSGGKFKDGGLSLNFEGDEFPFFDFRAVALACGLGGLSWTPHSESADHAALGVVGRACFFGIWCGGDLGNPAESFDECTTAECHSNKGLVGGLLLAALILAGV